MTTKFKAETELLAKYQAAVAAGAFKLELCDLLRTDKTYKTRDNAVKALELAAKRLGVEHKIRYVIAVNEDGRFAPVVIGMDLVQFALAAQVTVVS